MIMCYMYIRVFPQGFKMRVQRTPLCGVKGSFKQHIGFLKYFGLFFQSKYDDISYKLSGRWTIHIECQVLFSQKNKF